MYSRNQGNLRKSKTTIKMKIQTIEKDPKILSFTKKYFKITTNAVIKDKIEIDNRIRKH